MTSDAATSRTSGDVRNYLLQQTNSALRRPGMFGGEVALRLYFDALAFVDGLEQLWREDVAALQSRDAFVSTGVTGAVEHVLGYTADDVVSSVYAEVAYLRTWLVLDQALTPVQYGRLRDTIEPWSAHDRSHSDVLAEFGPPSMLIGGPNPLYPKTLTYGTANPDDPLVFFHLWNGTAQDPGTGWPPDHDEPQLLATRCGGTTFIAGFSFTPRGTAQHERHKS